MAQKSFDLGTVGGRLGWALHHLGRSQSALQKELNLPSGAASLLVNNKRGLNQREAPIAAEFLGVQINWLMTGRGPIWLDPLKNEDIDDQFERVPLGSGFERIPLDEDERAYTDRERYLPKIPGAVPELDISAGAGEGVIGDVYNLPSGDTSISGHRVVAEWKFPDAYIRHELGLSLSNTIIAPVKGDSMFPTYRDGDRVIVDLRVREFGDDGVYFITDGQSAPRIKRLEYVFNSSPPTVRIISDNPASAEQMVPLNDISIVGMIAGRITRG